MRYFLRSEVIKTGVIQRVMTNQILLKKQCIQSFSQAPLMRIILFELMLRKICLYKSQKKFFGSYRPISDQLEKMAFPQNCLP